MTRAEALALLEARIASIPQALDETREIVLRTSLAGDGRELVTTGVGLSEGPARLLAALARTSGRRARFVPLAAFAGPTPPVAREAELVVISQGLSPNARLALACAPRLERPPLLLTSATSGAPGGVRALVLPPRREDGIFLRVVGPAVAAYAAVCLAEPAWSDHHAAVRAEYGPAKPEGVGALARGLDRPAALVLAGDDAELAFALRWKLLESLRVNDPPVWDVLQLAHGPAQAAWASPLTLVALERTDDPTARRLFDALEAARSPAHGLVRLRSRLPGPLTSFTWDAAMDHALLAALSTRDVALDRWPATTIDTALYQIDAPLTPRE